MPSTMNRKNGWGVALLVAALLGLGALELWTEVDPQFEEARVAQEARRADRLSGNTPEQKADRRACDAIMKQQAEMALAGQGEEARKIDVAAVCDRKEFAEAKSRGIAFWLAAVFIGLVGLVVFGPMLLFGASGLR